MHNVLSIQSFGVCISPIYSNLNRRKTVWKRSKKQFPKLGPTNKPNLSKPSQI
jgi:hypothetical protein